MNPQGGLRHPGHIGRHLHLWPVHRAVEALLLVHAQKVTRGPMVQQKAAHTGANAVDVQLKEGDRARRQVDNLAIDDLVLTVDTPVVSSGDVGATRAVGQEEGAERGIDANTNAAAVVEAGGKPRRVGACRCGAVWWDVSLVRSTRRGGGADDSGVHTVQV